MEILAYIFLTVGWIWFVIEAFNESFWWAVGCFFIPFVSLLFLINHFDKVKYAFFIQIIGVVLLFTSI